jgi:tripartite-type tricarboxylate transporter receptor subunit TctC
VTLPATIFLENGKVMKFPRRNFLRLAAGATFSVMPRNAKAQTFPSRPITLIVPYPPGGSTDVIARLLIERMRGPLGQPIIIENVAGANGSIGVGHIARAAPDGHTLTIGQWNTLAHLIQAGCVLS